MSDTESHADGDAAKAEAAEEQDPLNVEQAVLQAALRGETYDTGWSFGFADLADVVSADASPDAEAAADGAATTSPISEAPLIAAGTDGSPIEPFVIDGEGEEDSAEAAEAEEEPAEQVECAFRLGEARPLDEAPWVSADFLWRLLLGLLPDTAVPAQGLSLVGVRIKGKLSLNRARGPDGNALPGLVFNRCHFDRTVYAQGARLERLEFWDCLLPSLDAEFLSLAGPLGLYDSVITASEKPDISIPWAQIDGAIGASGLKARPGASVLRILIFQARVRGLLTLENIGDLEKPDQLAVDLRIWDSHFDTAVNLSDTVFLDIDARDCRIESNLELARAYVRGSLNFRGSEVAGTFWCDRIRFMEGASGIDISAAHLGGALLMRRADIFGCIKLTGSRIDGGWELDGTHLKTPPSDGMVIAGREAEFGGSVWMRSAGDRQFEADGLIYLRHARIEGDLEIVGAACRAMEKETEIAPRDSHADCIYARAIHVTGDVNFGGGRNSVFAGRICLDRAEIGGDFDICGAAFSAPAPHPLLTIRDGRIAGQLRTQTFAEDPPTEGVIDLTGLHVGVLSDDDGAGWGRRRRTLFGIGSAPLVRLRLNGFTYDRLDSRRTGEPLWKHRKTWLDCQDFSSKGEGGFHTQPYEQLARALRAEGWEEDARRIALLKRTERRKRGRLSLPSRIVSFLYSVTFGYGLSPFRAALTLALYWGGGFAGLWFAQRHGLVVQVSESGTAAGPCAGYNPALHAVELMVPISNVASGSCGIDPAHVLWKAAELGYTITGAILVALAVLTFSGVTRTEMSR